ncbi:hypothetical protein J7L49_04880 [Candidatus Bathyarchaeota archaeon]|nr:hypothetical protein [Candidatus Bathyarchaeota archaeon]
MSEKSVHNNSRKIVVYSAPDCDGCDSIKASLLKKGIEFEEIDCTKQQLMCLRKGILWVPAIEIDGKIYKGAEAFKVVKSLT